MLFPKRKRHYSPDPIAGAGGAGSDPEKKDDNNDEFTIVKDGDKEKLNLPADFFGNADVNEPEPEGSDNSDDVFPEEAGLKFKKKYAGKGVKELLSQIHTMEQFIGSQATDLGKEREKNKPQTSEQMQKALEKTNNDLDKARDDLHKLDPVDDKEDYDALKQKIQDLRANRDSLTKELPNKLKSELSNPLSEEKTMQVTNQVRQAYTDAYKAEFRDKDWAEIVTEAFRISDGGKITEDDIHASVLLSIGAATYHKMLMGQASFKTRQDISKASGMVIKTIGDGVTGKGGQVIDLEDLTNEQIVKLVQDPKTPRAVKARLFKLRTK